MVTRVGFCTTCVCMRTVADLEPAGIVTVAGSRATDGLLLINFTINPPAGAGAVKVKLAAVMVPPCIELDFRVIFDRVGAWAVPLSCR